MSDRDARRDRSPPAWGRCPARASARCAAACGCAASLPRARSSPRRGLAGVALVQLAARTVALEFAPWLDGAVAAVALARLGGRRRWRLRPSLAEAARRADDGARPAGAPRHRPRAGRRADPEDPPRRAGGPPAGRRARRGSASVDLRRAFRPRLAAPAVRRRAASRSPCWWCSSCGRTRRTPCCRSRSAARDAGREVAERIEEVADEAEQQGAEDPRSAARALIEQLREPGAAAARGRRRPAGDAGPIGAVQEQLARLTDPQAAQRDAGAHPAGAADLEGRDRRGGRQPGRRPGGGRDGPRGAQGPGRAMSGAAGSRARRGPAAQAAQGAAGDAAGGRRSAWPRPPTRSTGRRAAAPSRTSRRPQEALERAADAVREAEQDRQLQRNVARAQSALQDGARQVARAGQPQPGSRAQSGSAGWLRAARRIGPAGQRIGPAGRVRAARGIGPAGRIRAAGSGQPGHRASPARTAGRAARRAAGRQPGDQPGDQPGHGPAGHRRPAGRRRRHDRAPHPGRRHAHRRLRRSDPGQQGLRRRRDRRRSSRRSTASGARATRATSPAAAATAGPEQPGSGSGVGFDNDAVVPYRSVSASSATSPTTSSTASRCRSPSRTSCATTSPASNRRSDMDR